MPRPIPATIHTKALQHNVQRVRAGAMVGYALMCALAQRVPARVDGA